MLAKGLLLFLLFGIAQLTPACHAAPLGILHYQGISKRQRLCVPPDGAGTASPTTGSLVGNGTIGYNKNIM